MTHAPAISPVACRSVLLLWLFSGLVSGFLVAAPRLSQPRHKHAAQSGGVGVGVGRGGTRGGGAAASTLPLQRARGSVVEALPAVAKGVVPEEEVGQQGTTPVCW